MRAKWHEIKDGARGSFIVGNWYVGAWVSLTGQCAQCGFAHVPGRTHLGGLCPNCAPGAEPLAAGAWWTWAAYTPDGKVTRPARDYATLEAAKQAAQLAAVQWIQQRVDEATFGTWRLSNEAAMP